MSLRGGVNSFFAVLGDLLAVSAWDGFYMVFVWLP